jgi:hypothetical protein
MPRHLLITGLLFTAACGGGGDAACGITALAGATVLLDQFSIPRQTLSAPPVTAPEFIPVRVAAGPALRGFVSLVESGWAVTLEGDLPPDSPAGFGVLVLDGSGEPRGIMLYSGSQVSGAPLIGVIRTGGQEVPLLGIRVDVAGLEAPGCPFFPDSLAGP